MQRTIEKYRRKQYKRKGDVYDSARCSVLLPTDVLKSSVSFSDS